MSMPMVVIDQLSCSYLRPHRHLITLHYTHRPVTTSFIMNSSVKTLCRTAVAAPRALRLSVNQARRLSTTTPDAANGREGAVHDPIMDKFWRAETVSPRGPHWEGLRSSCQFSFHIDLHISRASSGYICFRASHCPSLV
ncbi:hypothetical protein FSOLCH5_008158 [Fusarium solani]